MTDDARSLDDPTAAMIPKEDPYRGSVGTTRMEAVHWTQADGTIASVRVHTAVNSTTDPALAERLISGNLNWVQLGGSDEMMLVSLPVIYHDEQTRIFVLVMPESHRTRELAERASLLARLAEDQKSAIPSYVLGYRVVYAEELAFFLETQSSESLLVSGDESEIAIREDAIVSREAKLSEWEDRLRVRQQDLELDLKQREILDRTVSDEQEAALEKRTQDIDGREAELREVERHLMERQLEVERQEKMLQHRVQKLAQRELSGEPEEAPRTDSPTRVADRESMEMAARESAGFAGTDTSGLILDGPRGETDLDDDGLGADDEVGLADEPADLAVADDDDFSDMDVALESAGQPAGQPAGIPPRKRRRDTEATPLAQAVLAVTEREPEPSAEYADSDGVGEMDEVGGAEDDLDGAEDAGDGAADDVDGTADDLDGAADDLDGAAEDIGEAADDIGEAADDIGEAADDIVEEADDLVEEADDDGQVLPDELAGWRDQDAPQPTMYDRDGKLHLAAVLPGERAELFVGVDPAAVFQLHEFPTYPLLVLGLVAEEGEEMSELDPPVAFWPLDVRSTEDQALLERLSEDFRFVFEVYDDDFCLVTSSEVHYPLEENARIVRERALHWLDELEMEPDLEAARRAFLDPEYRWLPVGDLPFGPLGFEAMETAAAVVDGLAAIGEWSQPDKEDELILLRSYPASRWRRTCLDVLRKAVDFGIWMEADLRRRALDAGYATSRKDLLRGCLAGFERVCLGELTSELSPAVEHDNWQALLSEAERLGIVVDPSWEELADKAAKRQQFAQSEDDDDQEEASEGSTEYEDDLDVQEVDDSDVQEVDDSDVQEVDAEDLIMDDELDEGEAPGGSGAGSDGGALAEGELNDMAPAELVVLLGNQDVRLAAALELCRRREIQAGAELFANLEQMRKPEIIRLFPHLVDLGEDMVPLLHKSLRSGSTIIRQGSALALGALGDDQSAEELVELLLDEPTEIWLEVAQGLGDLGPGALMAVASHVRHASGQQWERLSHAMAAISYESGQRDLLVELSRSRDEDAGTVARRALDILSERRQGGGDGEEDLPSRDNPVLFFSRRFFDARAKDEAELGEDDILEEQDIVQNGDVMGEKRLPEEG